MFGISLQFKNALVCGLTYRTEEKAKAALDQIRAATGHQAHQVAFSSCENLYLEDDFGTGIVIASSEISAAIMENFDKIADAQIERGMVSARMQAKLQSKAMSDPILKSVAMMSGDIHRMNGPMRG